MNREEIIKQLASSDPEPFDMGGGHMIKPTPCISSGMCCTSAPCAYGEWNEEKSQCKFLLPGNEFGQKKCEKYDWIKENVSNWKIYPAFHAGCGSAMFNDFREEVIRKFKEKQLSKI